MKILVTGGAGFIGSALVRYLMEKSSDTVINVDKLTYAGNLESLRSVADNKRYHFEQADVCDHAEISRIFNIHKPDAVMHLAAESHVDRSVSSPEAFIQTNVVGTYSMLEAARDYWKSLDHDLKDKFRFHHISTDEVYGDLNWDEEPFNENSHYKPSSPYSASKAASDHLVRAWHRTYKLPVVLTNCSNNYGPYHFPEKLIPLVILNALEGNPLPVFGSGDQVRDWLYVDDHVRALYRVLIGGKVGETYNIGSNNEKSNIDVVQSICDLLDSLVPLNHGSYRAQIIHVDDRPGHDKRYAIDARKIKNEIGWMPEETFETGLKKTVLWYLDNRDWCNRVKNVK